MILKGLIFILVLLFLCTDAKRRGGSYRIFSSSSSDESSSSSGKTIFGIIAVMLCCGCSIGCKIFKCNREEERCVPVQQQMNTLIDRHDRRLQPSTINQWNKTDSSADRSNTIGFILVPLPIQHVDDASEKIIDKNELEQIDVQDSTCPQEVIKKEEKYSVVVFIDDVKAPSHTN